MGGKLHAENINFGQKLKYQGLYMRKERKTERKEKDMYIIEIDISGERQNEYENERKKDKYDRLKTTKTFPGTKGAIFHILMFMGAVILSVRNITMAF